MVILVAEGKGAVESIGRTFVFLNENPRSILLFLLLFLVIFFLSVLLFGTQALFSVVPVTVPFLYLAGIFIQHYLTIFAWGSLTAYYVRNSSSQPCSATYEI
jgi:fatty acid desaturase